MLASFLHHLFEEGIIEISATAPNTPTHPTPESAALLASRARSIAQSLPPGAPDPDLLTAHLAAQALYHATYIYVHRESEIDLLLGLLTQLSTLGTGSESAFAADLTLSFAPQLLRLARATASADPLVAAVTDLLRPWPLSSVGVPEATPAPESPLPFFQNPALRALYIDRIIATGDRSRLTHPAVREAVTAAIGAHPELAPALQL